MKATHYLMTGAAGLAVTVSVAVMGTGASPTPTDSTISVNCGNDTVGNTGVTVHQETVSCSPPTTVPPTTTTTVPPTTTTTTVPPTTTTTTTTLGCTAGFGQPCMTAPAGYSSAPVWDDRFQGSSLDSTHWSNIKGGPLPSVGEWGQGSYGGTPVVNNGLTLSNVNSPASMVDTDNPATGKKLFTFPANGFYLQVKFKVTDMSQGFWPAIWFPWSNTTAGEEIDLFEGGMLGGSCPNASTANSCVEYNYGGASSADPNWEQGFTNLGVNATQQFVTVGLEYKPGVSAKIYYNGNLVLNDTKSIGSFANYNLLITPQGSPNASWHTGGPGTGSMEIAEVEVFAAP